MKPSTSFPVLADAPATDPGVDINWGFFPFMDALRDAVGGVMATTLIVAVALLVIAGVMWMAGRAAGSQGVQKASVIGIVVVVVGAILIGAANGIIAWAGTVDTGF